MNRAGGGWTVMNEMGIDGSCHGVAEQEDEAMSQPDEVEKWISVQPATKARGRSNECAIISRDHESAFDRIDRTRGTIHPPPIRINQGLQRHSPDSREEIPRTRMPRDSLAHSTAGIEGNGSQPDMSACIPRTTQTVPTLLEIPGLFPSLEEDNFNKWVRTCEQYRDRSYSKEAADYFVPLIPEDGEEEPAAQQPRRTVDNQQHTQSVEHRQNSYSPYHTDDVEDEPKTKRRKPTS